MNKDLDYYMHLPYRMEIVEDKDEGGYVVCFPELKGCITCGDTLKDAIEMAKDAKKTWLMAMLDDHCPIPEPNKNH